MYHCFGCGVHGDAISFLREFDNLSFNEAVEELAKASGMEIPRQPGELKQLQQTRVTQDALELAADFYEQQLLQHSQSEHARAYLAKRGLNQEIIARYRLGFAPPQRNNLAPICLPEQFSALVEARLVSTEYGPPFDLFQNRIVFPIRNTRGKTVGFGGRTLGNDKAKYINSPDSPIFHKSNEIYGLFEVYQQKRKIQQLLVVEGYMDVVSLAQFGIDYAVATLGTATNQDNLTTLLKHSRHLVFCFDGDSAGFNAAIKAMRNCLPLMQDGVELRFLLLPETEDPDTLIRKEGKTRFDERVQQAKPLSSFFFEVHSQGLDLSIPEHKGALKERASADLAHIASPTIRSAMKEQLHQLTNTWAQRKQGDGKNGSWKNNKDKKSYTPPAPPAEVIPVKRQRAQCICLALYFYPEKAAQFAEKLSAITDADEFTQALAFANFLRDSDISDTQTLLCTLTQQSKPRETFYNLFDGIELIPAKEAALHEAEELLARFFQQQRKNQLIDKQMLGPLSDAEKDELKSLSN